MLVVISNTCFFCDKIGHYAKDETSLEDLGIHISKRWCTQPEIRRQGPKKSNEVGRITIWSESPRLLKTHESWIERPFYSIMEWI